MGDYILKVKGLKKHFPIHGGVLYRKVNSLKAVDGIDILVKEGETVGLVGESGCGKTTVGRTILNLYKPTEGEVVFEGKNISRLKKREVQTLRKNMQIIFQDPFESLNSRHTVRSILEEPFIIHKIGTVKERNEELLKLLNRVGLSESAADRFPHEFSGGQRQRIGIARAIALNPKFIICDEPVSALDVSIQSQVLNLLIDLQREMHLSYLFISHDLTVVKHISDKIAVMYLGKIVEYAKSDEIYRNPLHPYTMALLSAIPRPDPKYKDERIILKGDVPSPIDLPNGCYFHARCPYAKDICRREYPELVNYGLPENEHLVSCHFTGKLR